MRVARSHPVSASASASVRGLALAHSRLAIRAPLNYRPKSG
jgi:hypothetical protein